MKIIPNRTNGARLKKIARSLVLTAVLITPAAATAHADDRRGGDRHGAGDRDWRAHEGRVRSYEPGVVYAPPVVYSPPQYEEPGFNLIVPLNIR